MTTVVVFDRGFGNVRSMVRALVNPGVDTTLTSDYWQSLKADDLVVSGVDAFAACMERLKKVDGGRVIYDRVRASYPVFGVCVGEQTMFEHDLEYDAYAAGIGLIDGSIDLLNADVVPHMGWDIIEAAPDPVLLNGVENERLYLVCSYAAMEMKSADTSRFDISLSDSSERVSWCLYGRSRFVAAYEHGPLSVMRFHPEKSGDIGSQLLENWIAAL